MDPDSRRVEAELADTLARHAALNERAIEIVAALEKANTAGDKQQASALAAQLDLLEARRARAMVLAQDASARLGYLRQHLAKPSRPS